MLVAKYFWAISRRMCSQAHWSIPVKVSHGHLKAGLTSHHAQTESSYDTELKFYHHVIRLPNATITECKSPEAETVRCQEQHKHHQEKHEEGKPRIIRGITCKRAWHVLSRSHPMITDGDGREIAVKKRNNREAASEECMHDLDNPSLIKETCMAGGCAEWLQSSFDRAFSALYDH